MPCCYWKFVVADVAGIVDDAVAVAVVAVVAAVDGACEWVRDHCSRLRRH